ncbi:MAG: roadblock/LC7 domain-containing protein [Halobacteriota archaeon]|nr:roadblock/LC7 domain-containing protein [Halobacteriota archaeon]
MTTTKEMLEKLLVDLKRTGNVEASAVVSRDGLLMASDIPSGVQAETFAAMNATMMGAAETAISELQKGIPDRVIIESKEAKVIVTGAGPKALLIVMTTPDAGLGLILVEMNKIAEKLIEVLK